MRIVSEAADTEHVGNVLFGHGRNLLERRLGVRPGAGGWLRQWGRRLRAPVYLAAIGALAGLILAAAALLAAWHGVGISLPLVLIAFLAPAIVAAETLVHYAITHVLPPRRLPKLDFSEGVPDHARTLVVIPTLVSAERDIPPLFRQLERHAVGNADPNIGFAVLTDFPDAPERDAPGDDALLESLEAHLDALRGRRPDTRFYLMHRERRWNPSEGCWMGWERKRGKLIELNAWIDRGERGSFVRPEGHPDDPAAGPTDYAFVITLDTDTVLPPGAAARLAGTIAHPLVRPRFAEDGSLSHGYTVLQPRVDILPTHESRSLFSRVFAGGSGVDLYARAVSDPYMDLFGEGIFVGKGIYDVAAMTRIQRGRVPENAILSHDLFEGGLGRAALVSDVIVLESYPAGYLAYVRRLHRWVRGDWQLLPWLGRRVPAPAGGGLLNPLTPLTRWLISQNLVRSLAAPSLAASLALGWTLAPAPPWAWTLLVLGVSMVPFLLGRLTRLTRTIRQQERGASSWSHDALRWIADLVFLPTTMAVTVSAIGVTLWRLVVSRRHLLSWRDAARSARDLEQRDGPLATWREMAVAPLSAVALAALVAWSRPEALTVAAPLLLAWLASPAIAYRSGRAAERSDPPLSSDQKRWLATVARRTWFYFERFVGPGDHWLPPDHFQESPRGAIAHRTSPTNIGLLLTSTLAAHDLGFLDARTTVRRVGNTLATIATLERSHGHLLNWYETQTLQPLAPRYVSFVDSGNFLASLVIVKHGCAEVLERGPVELASWRGVLVLLDLLGENARSMRADTTAIEAGLADVRTRVEELADAPERWSGMIDTLLSEDLPALDARVLDLVRAAAPDVDRDVLAELATWSGRLHGHAESMRRERDLFLPWLAPGIRSARFDAPMRAVPAFPTFAELGDIYPRWLALLGGAPDRKGSRCGVEDAPGDEPLPSAIFAAQTALTEVRMAVQGIAEEAERYLQEAEFETLYDAHRKVFRIGFDVDTGRQDEHAYDLLASEARIGSFLAIALGRVRQDHWVHLGRPFALAGGQRVLQSWSGSMFEYLMPALMMRTPNDSLLGHASRAAVHRQIAFGQAHGIPWGVSESGYARTDAHDNYQYRAFGVPDLALSRTGTDARVVAPYATLMALPLAQRPALRNLERLARGGALGRYGFYEAIDYTPDHLPLGSQDMVVRSYMAHHHGMSLLGLCAVLDGSRFVERFHADVRVHSSEILLYEATVDMPPLDSRGGEERPAARRPTPEPVRLAPRRIPDWTPAPLVNMLSNGRYTVFISNAGGGGSRWAGLDLSRWRADATRDAHGVWTYLHDLDSGRLWSATRQPTGVHGEHETVSFQPHSAGFSRRVDSILTRLDVTVDPDDDAEIRRLTVTNQGAETRHLAIASYGEVALAPHGADLRHPVYGGLFVESRWLPEMQGLLFRRRPRADDEAEHLLLHRLVVEAGRPESVEFESDRSRFLGRHGSAERPAALLTGALPGTSGAVLDPAYALRTAFALGPGATVRLAFLTLAGDGASSVLSAARRFDRWGAVEEAFRGARARQTTILEQLALGGPDWWTIEQLRSHLLYQNSRLRAPAPVLTQNRLGQQALWGYGISGDHPLAVVRVREAEDLELAALLLKAHRYWREQGFATELVLLNERDDGYLQTTHTRLRTLVHASGNDGWLDRPGGIVALASSRLDDTQRTLILSAARVVVGAGVPLQGALALASDARETRLPALMATRSVTDPAEAERPLPPPPEDLLFDNGLGGFADEGREYRIVQAGSPTPAPWVNVLANPDFGTLVSEAGSSTTWAVDGGENHLTPWSNDPVTDPSGEVLYLRDEETAEVWTPTPQPMPGGEPYRVHHEAGSTRFFHGSHDLDQRLHLFVPSDAPLKVVRLRLRNLLARPRRITVTYYAEWVLGSYREGTQAFVVPEYDGDLEALLARNPYGPSFPSQVAFLVANRAPHGLTTDREEFLGREGSVNRPAALARVGLSGRVEAGRDPCAVLQVHVDLPAEGGDEVFFLLGAGADREAARDLIRRFRDPARLDAAAEDLHRAWNQSLGAIAVRTPDPAMNVMLDRWLPYQTIACRLWGRTAFYQAGGAFGFRDQLQDVMAVMHAAPNLARAQLLRAARHQFEEGDVLHWWHPGGTHGVRTRISDDLAWLPFVIERYIDHTADGTVLDESVPFLQAPPLGPEEQDRYDRVSETEQTFSLYEHACRALDRACTVGPHGLPLMGGGDWNDGMNRVGIGGHGESTWLAWFLIATLARFAPLCEARAETARADRYRRQAEAYRTAVEAHAWDGNWYLRAFFDDGTPLGSHRSEEARIDSIAQSWSVLSGAGDPARSEQAMASVVEHLVRPTDGIVLLLTPPFDQGDMDPGYIKGYLPGIRENGGQYTHAAIWTAWAFAELGDGALAYRLFDLLNPVRHGATAEAVARYKVEPYVIAADVYGVAPHVGRGGWTWYTGSAAWMYRLGIEAILGLHRHGDALDVQPCISPDWDGFEVDYRFGASCYTIQVQNPHHISRGVTAVTVDGRAQPTRRVPLRDDGRDHAVTVIMGTQERAGSAWSSGAWACG
ncbi:MAG: glucoamylase family protein [Deinococcales bacterium]